MQIGNMRSSPLASTWRASKPATGRCVGQAPPVGFEDVDMLPDLNDRHHRTATHKLGLDTGDSGLRQQYNPALPASTTESPPGETAQ